MNKIMDVALSIARIRVECQTCGKVFVDMPYKDYLNLGGLTDQPTKWLIETGIHWCENPEHIIVTNLPDIDALGQLRVFDIQEYWRKKQRKDDSTRQAMLESLLDWRGKVAHKKV